MDQPTEDRIKKTEGTPNDILTHLKRIEEKLDRIDTKQKAHDERFDRIDNGLVMHSRNINALQADVTTLKTDVAALPTREDLAAMEERLIDKMRKYMRPGENGHNSE